MLRAALQALVAASRQNAPTRLKVRAFFTDKFFAAPKPAAVQTIQEKDIERIRYLTQLYKKNPPVYCPQKGNINDFCQGASKDYQLLMLQFGLLIDRLEKLCKEKLDVALNVHDDGSRQHLSLIQRLRSDKLKDDTARTFLSVTKQQLEEIVYTLEDDQCDIAQAQLSIKNLNQYMTVCLDGLTNHIEEALKSMVLPDDIKQMCHDVTKNTAREEAQQFLLDNIALDPQFGSVGMNVHYVSLLLDSVKAALNLHLTLENYVVRLRTEGDPYLSGEALRYVVQMFQDYINKADFIESILSNLVMQFEKRLPEKFDLTEQTAWKKFVDALDKIGPDAYFNVDVFYSPYVVGYDLALMSNLPEDDQEQAKDGKIYLSEDGTYVVRDPRGVVQRGSLASSEIDLGGLSDRLNEETLKKNILKVTSNVGHTNENHVESESDASNAYAPRHTVKSENDRTTYLNTYDDLIQALKATIFERLYANGSINTAKCRRREVSLEVAPKIFLTAVTYYSEILQSFIFSCNFFDNFKKLTAKGQRDAIIQIIGPSGLSLSFDLSQALIQSLLPMITPETLQALFDSSLLSQKNLFSFAIAQNNKAAMTCFKLQHPELGQKSENEVKIALFKAYLQWAKNHPANKLKLEDCKSFICDIQLDNALFIQLHDYGLTDWKGLDLSAVDCNKWGIANKLCYKHASGHHDQCARKYLYHIQDFKGSKINGSFIEIFYKDYDFSADKIDFNFSLSHFLEEEKYTGMRFVKMKFHSTSFVNLQLERCSFLNIVMTGKDTVDFSGSTLESVIFSACQLINIDFAKTSDMKGVVIKDTTIDAKTFISLLPFLREKKVTFEKVSITGDLQGIDLQGLGAEIIAACYFVNANLKNTQFPHIRDNLAILNLNKVEIDDDFFKRLLPEDGALTGEAPWLSINMENQELQDVVFPAMELFKSSFINCEFVNTKFDNLIFGPESKISKCKFKGASFKGAMFQDAELSQCELVDMMFDGSKRGNHPLRILDSTVNAATLLSFRKAARLNTVFAKKMTVTGDMLDVSFTGIMLSSEVAFKQCQLNAETFESMDPVLQGRLKQATFVGDMSFKDLSNLHYQTFLECQFENKDLRGVTFPEFPLLFKIDNVDNFKGCKVDELFVKKFYNAGCRDFRGLDLSEANLSGLDLQGADFRNCILKKTKFNDATRLDGCQFSHSKAIATMFNANLCGVMFSKKERADESHTLFDNERFKKYLPYVKRVDGKIDITDTFKALLQKEYLKESDYIKGSWGRFFGMTWRTHIKLASDLVAQLNDRKIVSVTDLRANKGIRRLIGLRDYHFSGNGELSAILNFCLDLEKAYAKTPHPPMARAM